MKITIKSLSKIVLAAVLSVSAFTFTANAQHAAEGHVDTTVHTEHAADAHVEGHAADAHPAGGHGIDLHETKEEKIDAGKLITEHIGDSYGWHLWGEGHHSVAIPLPIILYTDKGIETFSSGALQHGHATVTGKHYNYRLINNKVVAVNADNTIDEAAQANIYDFSITKNVAAIWFSIIIILVIFFSAASAYKKNPNAAPTGVQGFVEPIIIFIRDEVAKPAIGAKYETFMPFLLTVFFFIAINNLLGLVPFLPGGANVTGNIAVTAVLAAFTFIYVCIKGTGYYWSHIFFMPGVPKPLLLILTPIEVFGVFLRPFVLMVRLFANITAGHIIALAFFGLIFIFGEMNQGLGFGVGIFSVLFTVFMSLIEVLVAFIQAFVFTLLSAMYLGAAVEDAHH